MKRVRVNLKGMVCKIVEILTGKKWRFDVSMIGIIKAEDKKWYWKNTNRKKI